MKSAFIVAGGTGGHINAALSMGEELISDYEITYLTGQRYLDYQLFKNKNVKHLNSKPLRSRSVFIQVQSVFSNLFVFFHVLILIIKKNPAFLIGAGGYICGPCLLAGKLLGKKVFIIEQNAVVGLTNRLLAGISTLVFTNFNDTKGLAKIPSEKIKNCGNPIRKSIKFFENEIGSRFKILIFGGSLGADQINEAMQIILDKNLADGLEILHQTGKDNKINCSSENPQVVYSQQEFIDDMNTAYKWANIVVSRAGASTISELRIIRKPSILIPFPGATDNHQHSNAVELAKEGRFLCKVLDHNLDADALALSIINSINEIKESSVSSLRPIAKEAASLRIKREIFKCLD